MQFYMCPAVSTLLALPPLVWRQRSAPVRGLAHHPACTPRCCTPGGGRFDLGVGSRGFVYSFKKFEGSIPCGFSVASTGHILTPPVEKQSGSVRGGF